RITRVDEKWLVSGEDVKQLRDLMEKSDKDPSAKSELDLFRALMQDRVDHSMAPARAMKNLMSGTSGKVTVRWKVNGGDEQETVLNRADIQVAPVERRGATLVLRALTGAGEALKRELSSGSISEIDLRSGMVYDPEEIRNVLGVLAQNDIELSLSNEKGFPVKEIFAKGEWQGPTRFTLLVDKKMAGGLAIIAKALAEQSDVTLSGDLPKEPYNFVQAFRLADGTGYTLVTGLYPKPETKEVAQAEANNE
ncbi:MAG: hypothetical protein KF812_03730, partial [Fimbriimonadaceae bacterium]|nr:hypothetical protein [Fimbriimonadaceae bacterium]